MAERLTEAVATALRYWTVNPDKAEKYLEKLRAQDAEGLAPDTSAAAHAIELWNAQRQELNQQELAFWEQCAQKSPAELSAMRMRAHDDAQALRVIVDRMIGSRGGALGVLAGQLTRQLGREADQLLAVVQADRAARELDRDPGCGHPVCKGLVDCMAPKVGSGGA